MFAIDYCVAVCCSVFPPYYILYIPQYTIIYREHTTII